MRLQGHRARIIIVSVLLMMVCVQSFSMHFHLGGSDDDHHHEHHAHTHVQGSVDTDHLTTEHEDEVSGDIPGVVTKKSFSYDLFIVAFIAFVAIAVARRHSWPAARAKRPRYQLPFFRPPLRAPPL